MDRWLKGKLIDLRSGSPVPALLVGLVSVLIFATSASAEVQPAEVRAYREDFSVPAVQAEEALEIQGLAVENEIVEGLEQRLDERYAGMWFDNQTGEFVVPVLPGASRAVDAELSAAQLGQDFRTVSAQSSWDELEAAQERLNDELRPLIEAGLVQTQLDPRTNSVTILVAQGADAVEQAQVEELAKNAAVTANVVQSTNQRFDVSTKACTTLSPRMCDAPLRGGSGISHNTTESHIVGQCSVGFKAVDNLTGARVVLTAGHCAAGFSKWTSDNSKGETKAIGSVTGYTFPGGDWGKINANGGPWDTPSWPSMVAHFWEDQERDIYNESGSYLGQYVCHSGNRSGTSCGGVSAVDKTIDVQSGETLNHLVEFGEVCSRFGDSGGPVFVGNTALGLFSASTEESKFDQCDATAYYAEITEATDAMGVTVAPRVGAPPVATTEPGVASFPLHGATVTGKVDPNGLPTTYVVEYGPTAAYGSTTGVASAGSGWSPVSVNRTLTGLKGLTGYHFRLVASNSAGNSYGVDQVFSTPDWRPAITVDPATNRTTTSATLNARINPQGSSTTYYIEWGSSAAYGSKVPVSPVNIGSGTSNVAVSQEITGLTAERDYHYRVVATNSEGTSYSPDATVWTKAQSPVHKLAFGSAGSGNGQLKGASGVAVDASGNVWVADTENNRIEKFSPEGAYLSKFGSLGSANGQLNKPTDLVVAPNGNLWVVDSGNSRIQQFTPSGAYVSKFGSYGFGNSQFIKPFGIGVTAAGNLWITDVGASNLKEFEATGAFIRIGGNNFVEPKGLDVDSAGYVWVADSGNDRIQKISPTGQYAFQFGSQGSGDGQLSEPSDIVIRGSGSLLVADTGNDRIQQFGPNSELLAKYGTAGSGSGQFSDPQAIALAPGGLEYVLDTGNNRVQKWQQAGDYESPWHSENLSGVLSSDPEICSWGADHVEVFGKGLDNALWHKYWNGSAWSNWESLGGTIASAPGCVSWGANRLDVVARAPDNSVIQWWWNGSVWQSGSLGGNIAGDPDIASWGPNRLDVFGRAPDGSIAHRGWTGSSWTAWENLGGANAIVSGVGAVGSGGNRIDVVGRAANNSVFHLYFLGSWYTANQGGSIKGDPDISSWGPGYYNIWARGAGDDMLYTKYWTGSAWSSWESTGQGPISSSPGAVAFQPWRSDVVTLDANSSVRHWMWW